MESLGSRIKQLRLRAKLNKAALARKVGVSDVTISYWESGAIKQIGHERLVALADALDCSLATLLEGDSAAPLLILTHTGPLPWEQVQATMMTVPHHLPLKIDWKAPCIMATPGQETDFSPVLAGDLVLLGPTHVFHKAGHYLIQQEQGYVIEHFAKAPSDTTIHAVLLAHWSPA
ncbi:MAG: helix-turn-helix domain-containing protein [Vreelandella alkaliphila]|uniref:Transcriptional regulator n=1 Tax=Halomonas campaniensis TaxID=213554 RepID=A0A3D0KE58_9GAMM|nr:MULTISPECIES: helix-turn-helix domain-containing protein [unclassified Halomonas]HBP42758.1 transcriptional regulator [Halomonas sp.]HBS84171.1 transcriptional regulator [Halomonas campaniensis]HCA01449.1 transcriptional regulator [Halomonas campaniensis]